MPRHVWIGLGMTLIGTIIFALRKQAFWGPDFMYRRENEPSSVGARLVATVVGASIIAAGILVIFDVIPT